MRHSDHLTQEAKEKLCELEEEQQLQDTLSKEAAARAAIEAEQTKVLYEMSNFERKQAELHREKIELSIKYKETLAAHASSSDVAVNTVLITPSVTPAKGRTDHFLSVYKKRELDKEKEKLEKQKKEKEDKLLKEVNSMDIETVNQKQKIIKEFIAYCVNCSVNNRYSNNCFPAIQSIFL